MELQAGDGYSLLDGQHRFTLTIEDNDAVEVSFQGFEGSVSEDGDGYPVTVELGQTLSSPLIINYATRGRATQGEDYTSTGYGKVEVPAGSKSADIRINITDDGEYEGEEMVVLTLEEGLYTVGKAATYRLTILDDDPAPDDARVVKISHYGYHTGTGRWDGCDVHEEVGGCRPVFYVEGGPLTEDLDVIIKYVADSTATVNEDFTIRDGPVARGETFTVTAKANTADDDGVSWARIFISYVRDGKNEGRETAIFRLVNGPGYVVEGPTDKTVTISD